MRYQSIAIRGAIVSLVVAIILLLWRASTVVLGQDGIAALYRDTLTPTAFTLWCGGWVMATFVPSIIALANWFLAPRSHREWLFHLLLVPTAFAVVAGSKALMRIAAGEPDDAGPTGWAAVPAFLIVLVVLAAYYVALWAKHRTRDTRAAGD